MTWQRDESLARTGAVTRAVNRRASGGTGAPGEQQFYGRDAAGKRARAKLPAAKLTKIKQTLNEVKHATDGNRSRGENTKIEKSNLENEGYLIKELQQRLRTQIEARIRAKGLWLSFPHSVVLMTLREEPGLSGAQLARRNSVTAQTMNGLLMPLESKGLIERRADPENARILKCFLKPKGAEVLAQGMHEASAVFSLMMGKLSERERDEFRRILRRCIDALQAGGVPTPPAPIDAAGVLTAAKSDKTSKRKARH